MPGAYTSRNAGLNGPLNGVQPPAGSISNGRYAVNNLPVALSQVLLDLNTFVKYLSPFIVHFVMCENKIGTYNSVVQLHV